jgi:hypothetical protein
MLCKGDCVVEAEDRASRFFVIGGRSESLGSMLKWTLLQPYPPTVLAADENSALGLRLLKTTSPLRDHADVQRTKPADRRHSKIARIGNWLFGAWML